MYIGRLFAAILALSACAAAGQITQDEARTLAEEGLKAKHVYAASVALTPIEYAKDFYTFEATWPNPEGSPNLGSYAVNEATGDVWQVVVCRPVTSAALRRMQEKIRARFGYSGEEYRKLRARKPGC